MRATCAAARRAFVLQDAMRAFVLLSWVVLVGCGAPPGSCEVEGTAALGYTVCVDYTGASYGAMNAMSACTTAGGTFSSAVCPPAPNGTCTFNGGTQAEYKYRFDTSVS